MPSNVRNLVTPAKRRRASLLPRLWLAGALLASAALVIPSSVSADPGGPVNTSPPLILGTARVDYTLTATAGTWNSPGENYTTDVQWQRCASGQGCVPILGATEATYVVVAADAGATLRVAVTATNKWGSSTAQSEPTDAVPVPLTPPVNTGLPVISGSAVVGATLSAGNGSWSGSTPLSFTYQWQSCASGGSPCADVAGATGSTYVLSGSDAGHSVRIEVTASNSVGSASATSAATTPVASPPPPPPSTPPLNTGLPVISGSAVVGATLSAGNGSWSGSTPMSFAYQWQSCASGGSPCADVAGATSSTFVLSGVDAGHSMRIEVTASNSVGSALATSAATAPVASESPTPPVNSGLPMISGSAIVSSTLSASAGIWSGATPMTFAYQWLRCDSAGAGCAPVAGATFSSYLTSIADLGKTLRTAVTATNGFGSATAISAATAAVTSSPPPTSGSIPGTGILRLGDTYPTASGYDRYRYVITGRGYASQAAALSGTSLVYHSGIAVNSAFDAGVPYSQALANDWLLRSSSGAFITARSYPTSYLADVGSTAYQQAWIANVLAFLGSSGVDGVYVDDVAADVGVWSGGVYPVKYLNQVDWENAMASFVAAVGSALRSRGYYVLVSAGKFISGNSGSNDGSLLAGWWQRLAPSVSGLFHEYWMQSPLDVNQLRGIGPEWWNNWDGWQRLVSVAQGGGADFVGLTYGSTSNLRNMRYAKASFLLDWVGGGGALIYEATDGPDPWNSAWTTDVGGPTGAKTQIAAGVWLRRYSRGTVIVNANLSGVTVTVDGISRAIAATDAVILTS